MTGRADSHQSGLDTVIHRSIPAQNVLHSQITNSALGAVEAVLYTIAAKGALPDKERLHVAAFGMLAEVLPRLCDKRRMRSLPPRSGRACRYMKPYFSLSA